MLGNKECELLNDSFKKGFSIVLCTHNGKSRIRSTLAHLVTLHLPIGFSIELVLVDNASTDGTSEYVQQVWTELGAPFPLQMYTERRLGKGYAVESGYDAAQYSYIVTVDDDNWLNAEYLTNAKGILECTPEIGILQGINEGVFEILPPFWLEKVKASFVIGSPIQVPGYFPEKNFHVWGAGMIIRKYDWSTLRSLGFSFLTSKIPGKAAGEDNETAIGLLMLGKKIYYSDRLKYKHFMPVERIKWDKLKVTFETSGYTNYFFFLYDIVLDSHNKGYTITNNIIKKRFIKYMLKLVKSFTLKQHLAYWFKPQQDFYQLRLTYTYSIAKWFFRLHRTAMHDVKFLQSWMGPLLPENRGFKWHGNIY